MSTVVQKKHCLKLTYYYTANLNFHNNLRSLSISDYNSRLSQNFV